MFPFESSFWNTMVVSRQDDKNKVHGFFVYMFCCSFDQQVNTQPVAICEFFLGEETYPCEVTVCIPTEWMP